MSIVDWLTNLVKPRAKQLGWFQILPDHFIGSAAPSGEFELTESYFQVVVNTILLSYSRKFWVEFNPLVVTLTDAIYGAAVEQVPNVLGQKVLERIKQVTDADRVEFSNQRVAGPQPYVGDRVNIFTGLWASPTRNFANEILDFASTLNQSISTPQLSTCLALARPLTQGLQTLLGIQGLQLRVGRLMGFNSASDPTDPNRFRPGYFAMVNQPVPDTSKFWVKNDRLFFGSSADTADSFADADYVLFSILKTDKREDIVTFSFYDLFKQALSYARAGKVAEADDKFARFVDALADSPDFTMTHRKKLQLAYAQQLAAEKTGHAPVTRAAPRRAAAATRHPGRAVLMDDKGYFIRRVMAAADRAGISTAQRNSLRDTFEALDPVVQPSLRLAGRRGLNDNRFAADVMSQKSKAVKIDPKALARILVDASRSD